MARFVGVDPSPGGWVTAGLEADGRASCRVAPALADALAGHGDAELVLVNLPIGLVSGAGERRCDTLLRARLGPRRASVFAPPCRQALSARSHAEASAVHSRVTGRRLSRQAWALAPRIREVEAFLSGRRGGPQVRETHSELCFSTINGGTPLRHAKRTAPGARERTRLLARQVKELHKVVRGALASGSRAVLRRDAVLDALAAAVTARMSSQHPISLPDFPPRDTHGLPMEVVYATAGPHLRGRRRVLVQGRHLRFVVEDGWEYVERNQVTDIAVIVAVTERGRLLLVEQHRPPVKSRVIELPAGLVGDLAGQEGEDPALGARRELLEETGYTARRMTALVKGPPSVGVTSEIVTFFRAEGLHKAGPGGGDGSETIRLHEIALHRVDAFLRRKAREGLLIDPKVWAGLHMVGWR